MKKTKTLTVVDYEVHKNTITLVTKDQERINLPSNKTMVQKIKEKMYKEGSVAVEITEGEFPRFCRIEKIDRTVRKIKELPFEAFRKSWCENCPDKQGCTGYRYPDSIPAELCMIFCSLRGH